MTQDQALTLLKLGHNVFLTGPAGSGKTFTLNTYIQYLLASKAGIGVTASTGIAATHIGGITIHSWSGIGIKDALTDDDISTILSRSYLRNRIAKTSILIIDEVSMLHAQQLDMVNQICQQIRQNPHPFGGIQVILCGDLFQLPPVVRQTTANSESTMITNSRAWQEADFKICYLEQQFRQTDNQLHSILQAIRHNEVDQDTVDALQEQVNKTSLTDQPTRLYSHNRDVDTINDFELGKITGEERTFDMRLTGQPQLIQALVNGCLAPQRLVLKIGAMVMFVKNNFEKGYVNGTLGTVVDWNDDGLPIVQTLDGRTIEVEVGNWKIEEDGRTRAEVIQIPLRLAWAITIHKSQGMSLDAAEVDLSKSFVPGMGYVALSRLRTLDGLTLKGLNGMALRINEAVLDHDDSLRKQSAQAVGQLSTLDADAITKQQQQFLADLVFASLDNSNDYI